MVKYLYEVRLAGGTSNKNYSTFFVNVSEMGAVATDHGGIGSLCVISYPADAKTLKMRCTSSFPKLGCNDVTVEEITKATLNEPAHAHSAYWNVLERFIRNDRYPNIE